MTPIVNGLEAKYADEVDFQFLDASFGAGKDLFEHYGNIGHPSYILIDRAGEVQYRATGPSSLNVLETELLDIVNR
jgi:hypothetical protein